MLFKDLKNGYPIYVFDRSGVDASQGKVVSVGVPHLDPHYGSPTDMVVDVTIDFKGQVKTYTFKDSTEIGYVGNFVISTGRDGIVREVEAFCSQREQVLSQVEKNKEELTKGKAILAEFNPAIKEKQENEERFSKLEGSVGELKTLIQGLVKDLKGEQYGQKRTA